MSAPAGVQGAPVSLSGGLGGAQVLLPGLTVAESSACEDRAVCRPAALGPQWSSVACSQSQTAEPHLWGAGQALGSWGRWGCPGQSPWGEAASLPWHLAPGSRQRHLTRRWLGSPGRWTGRCPDSLSAISLSAPPLPPSDVLVSDPAPPVWPLRTPAVSNVPGQLSRTATVRPLCRPFWVDESQEGGWP